MSSEVLRQDAFLEAIMPELETIDRIYGVTVLQGMPIPPRVHEILTLPPWTHVWALSQLAVWVYRERGDLDLLLGHTPDKYQDVVSKAWYERDK